MGNAAGNLAMSYVGSNGKALNGKATNGKVPHGVVLNGKALNGKATNGKVPHGVVLNGKALNGKATNGKVPHGVVLNGKALNGKATNGKVPHGAVLNGKALNGKFSIAKTLNEKTFGSEAFWQRAQDRNALKFGDFTLKSGLKSNYFFDMGAFCSADDLEFVGRCYALALVEALGDKLKTVDVIFGPAYKGIPLVLSTAVALKKYCKINIDWCFNRKEAKDHGEGGIFVGSEVRKRNVVVIDDVLTAGTAAKDSVNLLRKHGAHIFGLAVALDRYEQGEHQREILEKKLALEKPMISIVDHATLEKEVNSRKSMVTLADQTKTEAVSALA